MADQSVTVSPADPSLLTEQRICPGCKQPVVTENGGVVVAFGCVSSPEITLIPNLNIHRPQPIILPH